jgi:hypothetical protein
MPNFIDRLLLLRRRSYAAGEMNARSRSPDPTAWLFLRKIANQRCSFSAEILGDESSARKEQRKDWLFRHCYSLFRFAVTGPL